MRKGKHRPRHSHSLQCKHSHVTWPWKDRDWRRHPMATCTRRAAAERPFGTKAPIQIRAPPPAGEAPGHRSRLQKSREKTKATRARRCKTARFFFSCAVWYPNRSRDGLGCGTDLHVRFHPCQPLVPLPLQCSLRVLRKMSQLKYPWALHRFSLSLKHLYVTWVSGLRYNGMVQKCHNSQV